MTLLGEIEQITARKEEFPKISADIDKIYYRLKGEGEERKLTFCTYNLVHRLVVSAFVWIVILLTNIAAVYYDVIYIGIIVSVVLLLLILTPIRVWVLDFKTEKVLSIFKILWIPITKKEYSKKSFWNAKIEVVFYIFAYVTPKYGKKPERPPEMEKHYQSLLQMENDANNAIKNADYGFVHINFKLVQRAKEHEIEGSMPKGKVSFLKARKMKKYENPFEVIIARFFTKKRLQFIQLFTEFFPLSEHFAADDEAPKTYNKLYCSYTKTTKYTGKM